jgi:hypothetical protein
MTTFFQSSSLMASTTAPVMPSQMVIVLSASRSSSVSPMQRTTLRPWLRAAAVFLATSSDVSLKSVRRSEWPMSVQLIEASTSMWGEISPVKAPFSSE